MAHIFFSPTVSGARRERADNHEVLFSRINNNQRNPGVGEKNEKKSETFLTIIPYAELVLRLNRPPVSWRRREERGGKSKKKE